MNRLWLPVACWLWLAGWLIWEDLERSKPGQAGSDQKVMICDDFMKEIVSILEGRLAGWLTGWLTAAGSLAAWLAGGWLAGWLAG